MIFSAQIQQTSGSLSSSAWVSVSPSAGDIVVSFNSSVSSVTPESEGSLAAEDPPRPRPRLLVLRPRPLGPPRPLLVACVCCCTAVAMLELGVSVSDRWEVQSRLGFGASPHFQHARFLKYLHDSVAVCHRLRARFLIALMPSREASPTPQMSLPLSLGTVERRLELHGPGRFARCTQIALRYGQRRQAR